MLPNQQRGLEGRVDANFSGNWNPKETQGFYVARSRHGYIISLEGFPIIFLSRLQTEFSLSLNKSEYMGLLYPLQDTTAIIYLLQETK